MVSVEIDALAMSWNEEAYFTRGKSMITHFPIYCQPSHNLLSCAWFILLDILNNFISQSFIPCLLLTTYSMFGRHIWKTTSYPYEMDLGSPTAYPTIPSVIMGGTSRGKSLEVNPSGGWCRHGVLYYNQQGSEP